MVKSIIPFLVIIAVTVTRATPAFAAPSKDALFPFAPSQVQLGDSLWKTEREADRKYLHDLDADRMLYTFRQNAGLPTLGAQPLGGWELPTSEVRGSFEGHYLSAVALMYAATGDKVLKAKGDYMVAEMAKCQKALAKTSPVASGYLSAFPTSFFDRLEAGKEVWAPYYMMHKIMNGMLDMYLYTGNKQAFQVAEDMAAYFVRRNKNVTDAQMLRSMHIEYGGMANILYDLYAIDHKPENLALAHRFDEGRILDPLSEQRDDLSGLHANTNIPKILGGARRYEVLGDTKYRTATSYFFDRVADHRSYATGGSNCAEFWGDPDKLAHTLVGNNQETCTSYNILKVARDLIRWTGDVKYADFYERAFFNGILPAQNPNNGMLIYYLPLAAGNQKRWGDANNTFWCCYGSGVEQFAKLQDSIYFHDSGDGLFVNLYTASSVDWSAKRVRVEQQTSFPNQDSSTLVVHAPHPTKLVFHLRVPYWTHSCRITVNGKPVAGLASPKPSSYAIIERTWKEGDRLQITMPMSLRAEPMPDDPSMRAMMYGPIVLAGEMKPTETLMPDLHTTGILKETSDDAAHYLKPIPGKPLTFETVGQATPTRFVPLYDIIDQRFGVYWTVLKPGTVRAADVDRELASESTSKREEEARIIDTVIPNNAASESEHHLLVDHSGVGTFSGGTWRDAEGWFEWELKTLPGLHNVLAVTYWGSDIGRTFDVTVNGHKIATQTLNNNKPGQLFTIEYPIPDDAPVNNAISVRFTAAPGSRAGGVFGVATLKPRPQTAESAFGPDQARYRSLSSQGSHTNRVQPAAPRRSLSESAR